MKKELEQAQLETLAALKLLRKGDAGERAVHQTRTGLRRLEAFADKRLPKKLRKIRKEAGRVRDLDIIAKLLNEIGAQSGGAEELRSGVEDRRRSETDRLRKYVKRAKLRKLKTWADKHVGGKAARQRDVLADLRWLLADRRFHKLDGNKLHEFRLALKPLRYRSEIAASGPARELAAFIHATQSKIGDWHDWEMLEAELRDGDTTLVASVQLRKEEALQTALQRAAELRDQLARIRAAAA